jgi:hypothetical protein
MGMQTRTALRKQMAHRRRRPSARTRRAAAGCAVFTTVVLGAVALVWSSTVVPDVPASAQVRTPTIEPLAIASASMR